MLIEAEIVLAMQSIVPYFSSIAFEIPLPNFFPADSILVSGFGLAFGSGLVIANIVVYRFATSKSLAISTTWNVLAIVNFGAIVASSFAHGILYAPNLTESQPVSLVQFRRGLSSIGGILFALVGCTILLRKRLNLLPVYADGVACGFLAGWPIARLGCILNHEHIAGESTFALARLCRPVEGLTIKWPDLITPALHDYRFGRCLLYDPPARAIDDVVSRASESAIAVHDLALYEAAFVAGMLLCFLTFRRAIIGKAGVTFLAVSISYASFRFFLEFLRPHATDPRYWGLTGAQWGLFGALVLIFSIWSMRAGNRPIFRSAQK